MEYIEARNVRFSNIFQQTELVHFQSEGIFSIPDDGMLVIKDQGDALLEDLNNVERKIVGVEDCSPYLVLTGVEDTEENAQVEYSGEIIFLDYQPTRNDVLRELI